MNYVSVRNIVLPLFRKGIAHVEGTEYLPEQGPYLLAANHIDFLDGFYISCVVHQTRGHVVHFLTKTNNYWWTRSTIPIDPHRRSDTVDDAYRYLSNGKIICNFMEGERNPMKYLLRGRTGTARLALAGSVPTIPVGMSGNGGKSFLNSLTNLMTGRAAITIQIGEPVDLDDLRKEQSGYRAVQEATDRIMAALVPLTGKTYIR
jgi:1-acyl-sn-glycerol-3-phosphate acyltransferase